MIQITVVVPIYNGKKYLKTLTTCLENQTFSAFTVVFVDDCSTDNSVDELRRLLKSVHFSYQIVFTEVNSGAGIARNLGMRLVNTPYFCFVDADDFLSENYLEKLYDVACKTGAEIVFSQSVRYWSEQKQEKTVALNKILRHLDDKNYITACADFGPCAKLMSTSLWNEKFCGFLGQIRGEDGSTIPVLYDRAKKFSVCNEAIYYYYQTPGSRSRSMGTHYMDPIKAWEILSKRLSDMDILEYKYVMAVGYGVIRNAIRYGASQEELKEYCRSLRERYPDGLNNRFFRVHPIWQKKAFVWAAYHKMIFLLKIMVKAVG